MSPSRGCSAHWEPWIAETKAEPCVDVRASEFAAWFEGGIIGESKTCVGVAIVHCYMLNEKWFKFRALWFSCLWKSSDSKEELGLGTFRDDASMNKTLERGNRNPENRLRCKNNRREQGRCICQVLAGSNVRRLLLLTVLHAQAPAHSSERA